MRMDVAKNGASNNGSIRTGKAIPDDSSCQLKAIQPSGTSVQKMAEAASDKNQVMDELLNQDQIPADYGTQMVALFRDKGQDVLTRDFAVQHIGLYAQTLNRRGAYDSDSAAPASCVMAVHLCGERRVTAASPALQSILDDGSAPEVLRRSARCALDSINGKGGSQ